MVKKHKSIFKKNALMMASIIIVLIISIFLIDQIQSRQANKNFNIGGNFILTNQNGEEYDSKQIKKKNSFILDTHFVQMFVHLMF